MGAVRVGIVGTSWWADAMYLPPLSTHEQAAVVAVSGRNAATTGAFADRWGIEQRFDDPIAMLDEAELDAVVVAAVASADADGAQVPVTPVPVDRG